MKVLESPVANLAILPVVFTCFLVQPAVAHHGPEHVIERINQQLAQAGPSARLLTRRAEQFRILSDFKAALRDYWAAVELAPSDLVAHLGLAQTLLHAGDCDEAISVAQSGANMASTLEMKAPFFAVAAQALTGQGNDKTALKYWRRASASRHAEIDWLLSYSDCLARLGYAEQACEVLHQATLMNPSRVLRRAWIVALIESGKLQQAEEPIRQGLAKSRWKASWLLLRARVFAKEGNAANARRDASLAFAEINSRLPKNGANPLLEAQSDEARRLMER